VEIIQQLEDLSAKAKKSKKLNKSDGTTVEELLALLLLEPDPMNRGFNFMLALPAVNVTKAFINAWDSASNDWKTDLVRNIISLKEWDSNVGQNREIELIKAFIGHSNDVAMIFLAHFCRSITASGVKKPSAKIIESFNKSVIASNYLCRIPLAEMIINSNDIGFIAAVVLFALSSPVDANDDDLNRDGIYLDWLSQFSGEMTIPAKLIQELEANTKKWPENLQRRCLQMGLIKTITIPYKPEISEGTTAEIASDRLVPQDSKTTGKNVTNVSNRKDDEKVFPGAGTHSARNDADGFNPFILLEQVTEYIHSLKSYNQRIKRELDTLRKTYEVERQQRLQMEEAVKLSEIRIKEIQDNYQKANHDLNYSRNLVSEMNIQLEQLHKTSNEKVTGLVDRMDEEVKQVIDEFKNGLTESLRFLNSEFQELSSEEITIEVGEHLRYLLKQVFSVMGRKGISF